MRRSGNFTAAFLTHLFDEARMARTIDQFVVEISATLTRKMVYAL